MATATEPINLKDEINLNENLSDFSQDKEHSKNIDINNINNDNSGNALNFANLNLNTEENNEQNEEQKNNNNENNEDNINDENEDNNNEEQEEQKQEDNSNEYVNQISKFENQNPQISDNNIVNNNTNKKLLPPIKNPPAYLSMVHMNPEIQNSYENNHISIGDYPFLTTGKFMQINPHFILFKNSLRNLSDEIYNNTKRCLVLKSSLQNSENLLKQESNDVIIDVVEKIYMLKTMCAEEAKKVHELYKEVNGQFIKLIDINRRLKFEVEKCEYKVNHCENEIGYKLLSKPAYSFMKTNATTS